MTDSRQARQTEADVGVSLELILVHRHSVTIGVCHDQPHIGLADITSMIFITFQSIKPVLDEPKSFSDLEAYCGKWEGDAFSVFCFHTIQSYLAWHHLAVNQMPIR